MEEEENTGKGGLVMVARTMNFVSEELRCVNVWGESEG